MLIDWSVSGPRGLAKGNFLDRYNQVCSIQESSLATGTAIWLGVDEALWSKEYDDTPVIAKQWGNYKHINGRMHLTQEMAAELWPVLKKFAEEGSFDGLI